MSQLTRKGTSPNPIIVDSHAHLELQPLVRDPEGVVSRARKAGVAAIVTVGIDLDDAASALDIAERFDSVFASVGFHRPADVQRAKSQLKGLGRVRAKKLLSWLLDADLRLKGTHSTEGRDRFLLEQFVMRLAKSAS